MRSCVFWAIAAGEKTDQPVMAADEHTVAFLDARPVFKGHLLVIPRLHFRTLADLPPELTGPLFMRVQQVSAAMAAASGTDGSFIGVNNTVTPSVPHLQVHVIPRTHRDGLRRTAAVLAYACGHLFLAPRQVRRSGRAGQLRLSAQPGASRHSLTSQPQPRACSGPLPVDDPPYRPLRRGPKALHQRPGTRPGRRILCYGMIRAVTLYIGKGERWRDRGRVCRTVVVRRRDGIETQTRRQASDRKDPFQATGTAPAGIMTAAAR